jgi:hypothetical protein
VLIENPLSVYPPVLLLFSVPLIVTVEWVERQEMKKTIWGGTDRRK